jgi:hypothetical protein
VHLGSSEGESRKGWKRQIRREGEANDFPSFGRDAHQLAVVPASVVVTRNKSNSANDNQADVVQTTVIDGKTVTLTRTGALSTQVRGFPFLMVGREMR